ncbi:hypothetical protein BJY01DRAFT_252230 [Aspergillus pseudoustus]|uniref:Uncharacterized protein n=1 Tax=Aspergillus pseudoustus TaxID=1810923 RepID=A0ABR4J7G8_9EURO
MDPTATNAEIILLLREIKELLENKANAVTSLDPIAGPAIDRPNQRDGSNEVSNKGSHEDPATDAEEEDEAVSEPAETLSMRSGSAISAERPEEQLRSPWGTNDDFLSDYRPPPTTVLWCYGANTFYWATELRPQLLMQKFKKRTSEMTIKYAEAFQLRPGSDWTYCEYNPSCSDVLLTPAFAPGRQMFLDSTPVPYPDLMPFARNGHGMTYALVAQGRGMPNYMPEWEIWRADGEVRHVDGKGLRLEAKRKSNPPHETDDGNSESSSHIGTDSAYHEEDRLVPYSLTPSWPSFFNGPEAPLTGLADQCNDLEECLGSLYSVPPDWRIHLTFEKDVLRASHQSGGLKTYLSRIRALWNVLHEHGSFQIADLDDFGKVACYEWRPAKGHESIFQRQDIRLLARHALEAEHSTVKIPPVICRFRNNGKGQPKYIARQCNVRWYRILSFRGLAAAVHTDPDRSSQRQLGVEEFCNLMFREVAEVMILRPGESATTTIPVGVRMLELRHAVDLHIGCRSRTEGANPFAGGWEPFHIAWFRIVPEGQLRETESSWKYGPLYGRRAGAHGQLLQEMAFTMGFWPSSVGYPGYIRRDPADVQQFLHREDPSLWYWVILQLAPSHFPQVSQAETTPILDRGGHMAPIGLILQAVEEAANSWNEIAEYLTRLINKRDAILDPQQHDGLLFDDSAFSRSRLYFWAIDCLDMFIPSIMATVREWEHFWEAREPVFEAGERIVKEIRAELMHVEQIPDGPWDNLLPLVENHITRLRTTQSRLEILRDQVTALRDGLFNASAVIESRAATELGENVRLLTYVSIVYLPLSFCAALWSIDFSYHPLVFTLLTVFLSTATYLIVINLNNVARLSKGVYRRFRARIVHSMVNNQQWATVGEAFSQFRPERENVTPSEWNMLLFLISRLLHRVTSVRLWFGRRGRINPVNVECGPP